MASIDLSFAALFAMQNGRPYAVTGSYDGLDLLNGGKHRATDVGNFGMDDPIKAATTRGRGLYHFDTAMGYEDDLGDGWSLERWHLNATVAQGLTLIPGRSDVGDWVNVTVGQFVGRTGNSGARLPNGQPMPAHTHIVLKRNLIPYDVEPYLLGAPFGADQESPMYDPAAVVNLYGTQIRALPQANVRSGPGTEHPIIANFPAGFAPLRAVSKVKGSAVGGNPNWWGFWVEVKGVTQVGYSHDTAVQEIPIPPPVGFTQAQLDAAELAGFTKGKARALVAVQGITP